MELSKFELLAIRAYFRIDERIAGVQERINRVRESFYGQSLLSHIQYNGLEVFSVGFNVESNVVPFVDCQKAGEQTIERLLKKKRYLNDYLNSLEPDVKAYLINRYSNEPLSRECRQADIDLLDEIYEIEDAISFMYGYPVEQREIRLDNSNLEDDFNEIAAMLGV